MVQNIQRCRAASPLKKTDLHIQRDIWYPIQTNYPTDRNESFTKIRGLFLAPSKLRRPRTRVGATDNQHCSSDQNCPNTATILDHVQDPFANNSNTDNKQWYQIQTASTDDVRDQFKSSIQLYRKKIMRALFWPAPRMRTTIPSATKHHHQQPTVRPHDKAQMLYLINHCHSWMGLLLYFLITGH